MAQRGAREGCRQKVSGVVRSLAVMAQLGGNHVAAHWALHHSPGGPLWKGQGSSGCFWSIAGPDGGDGRLKDLSLRPGAQLSPPSDEWWNHSLTHREGHRMGSEPFQFTDAPFHLGTESQIQS